ncbi:MAG: cyclase family protein [Caldilineaceae bacterium]|nr:cyclase family protein [Caldilineaceae bacterium]
MRIVDISGPIEDKMWSYGDPYPAPRIEQIPPPTWLDYPVYSQTVSFAVQSGTYLETAAHLDPNRMPIDQLPLDRCYLIDAVALWIPKAANGGITLEDLLQAQARQGVEVRPGDALLVGTGWDKQWYDPIYVNDPPHFTGPAMDWILDRQLSLLGGDTPRYDSPHNPQNFLPKFFQTEMLLLAPLTNLDQIQQPRGKLIALPLKIKDACASPVRALWIEE